MLKSLVSHILLANACFCLIAEAPYAALAASTAGSSADPTQPGNWLAQKICVTSSGGVARIDPYAASDEFGDACPAGYTIRNLREGDAVPYYKFYNPVAGNTSAVRFRYSNAYEIFSAPGETSYVMDRQFQPSNVPGDWYADQSFYPGASQWDLYEINAGWVSIAATRDTTGMNQTFYGNIGGTTPYNGWIAFPVSYFAKLQARPGWQATAVPVGDLYWEQAGIPWPAPRQTLAASNPGTVTTWKLLQKYRFDSGKTMDTLASYHQSQPLPASSSPDNGHLEVWYYTVPYGPARWEAWSTATCLAAACRSYIQSSCSTPTATMILPYHNVNYRYYRTDCADYERETALATTPSSVPTLPIPQANPLANFTFGADPVGVSGRLTGWQIGALKLTQLESKAAGDTGNGRFAGVRYVRLSCIATCSSDSTLSQTIAVQRSGTYSFGIEAESESSSGEIALSLSQIDSAGRLVGTPATISRTVDSLGDGSNCTRLPRVANCALYLGERVPVALQSGATKLRVTVTPLTAGIAYDVKDVFLSQVDP